MNKKEMEKWIIELRADVNKLNKQIKNLTKHNSRKNQSAEIDTLRDFKRNFPEEWKKYCIAKGLAD